MSTKALRLGGNPQVTFRFGVYVCLGYYNKIPQTEWVKPESCLSPCSGCSKSKIRVLADVLPGLQMAAWCCVFLCEFVCTCVVGDTLASLPLLIKDPSPIMRSPPLGPHSTLITSSRALPPNSHTGGRALIRELCEDTVIRSPALGLQRREPGRRLARLARMRRWSCKRNFEGGCGKNEHQS